MRVMMVGVECPYCDPDEYGVPRDVSSSRLLRISHCPTDGDLRIAT